MSPALLLHLHMEYADTRGLLRVKAWKRGVLALFYLAGFYLTLQRIPLLLRVGAFDFIGPGNSLGTGFAIVLSVALAWCAGWERRFATTAPDKPQRYFHWTLLFFFAVAFLALLYLRLVHRVGIWLEPLLPPEASASILLFVLVIFIEPLQRVLGRSLRQTAQLEMDRVQKLMTEIHKEARQGNVAGLIYFIERRIKEQLELREVWLDLPDGKSPAEPRSQEPRAALAFDPREFPVQRGGKREGVLHVEPHGAIISGDTRAALEFLCEQLP